MPSYAVSIPKLHRELVIVDGDNEREAIVAAQRGEGTVVGAAEYFRTLDPDVIEWLCVEVA